MRAQRAVPRVRQGVPAAPRRVPHMQRADQGYRVRPVHGDVRARRRRRTEQRQAGVGHQEGAGGERDVRHAEPDRREWVAAHGW